MTTFIYLGIYLLILAYMTWTSAKNQSVGDFLNSSKSLTTKESTWTTFASLLTGYNFVLGVTFSYLFGFWYLFIFLGAALAFVCLYYFYKKNLSTLQGGNDLYSLGDYFGIKFGKSTKAITNFVIVLALVLFLVLQMFVNTQLFSGLLGVSKIVALLITTGVVCVYLWFGGFKTSVKTDILQGILILPIILAIFSFKPNFSIEKVGVLFPLDQIWFAIGFAILQFLSLVAQAESFQRVFAVKDAQSLKKGLSYSFSLLCLVAIAIAYIGVNFKLSGVVSDPGGLFVGNVLTVLPAWLSSLLAVSLIAAFMGTIDSSAFAVGTILLNSFHRKQNNVIYHARLYVTGSIVISALISLYLFSFLSSVFALISVVSVIGTAMVFSFVWDRATKIEINTILVGGILTFIMGLFLGFVTDNPLTALIPSAVGVIIALLITPIKKLFFC